MQVQDGSGAVGAADQPARSLKHSQNVLALYVFERIRGCRLRCRFGFNVPVRFLDRQEIRSELENGVSGENNTPLDNVLQFANVSRPGVVNQHPHGFLRNG
jgi:hypothetical protein